MTRRRLILSRKYKRCWIRHGCTAEITACAPDSRHFCIHVNVASQLSCYTHERTIWEQNKAPENKILTRMGCKSRAIFLQMCSYVPVGMLVPKTNPVSWDHSRACMLGTLQPHWTSSHTTSCSHLSLLRNITLHVMAQALKSVPGASSNIVTLTSMSAPTANHRHTLHYCSNKHKRIAGKIHTVQYKISYSLIIFSQVTEMLVFRKLHVTFYYNKA